MEPAQVFLPYFDIILDGLAKGDASTQQIFGRHVHWGYWQNPRQADGSAADFAIATEELSRRVYGAAGVKNGCRLLDVGCGFGGTIASLNDTFNSLQIVGLNIDARQLEKAQQDIAPREENQIEFVEGNACQLPFEDASFDVVLAVECIFHFPSREQFFREARRVLRPGGRLALSDFVPSSTFYRIYNFLRKIDIFPIDSTYGNVNVNHTFEDYQKLAKTTGFDLTLKEDITRNTLPTYPTVRRLFEEIGQSQAADATAAVELASRLGLVRYLVLGFEVA